MSYKDTQTGKFYNKVFFLNNNKYRKNTKAPQTPHILVLFPGKSGYGIFLSNQIEKQAQKKMSKCMDLNQSIKLILQWKKKNQHFLFLLSFLKPKHFFNTQIYVTFRNMYLPQVYKRYFLKQNRLSYHFKIIIFFS